MGEQKKNRAKPVSVHANKLLTARSTSINEAGVKSVTIYDIERTYLFYIRRPDRKKVLQQLQIFLNAL